MKYLSFIGLFVFLSASIMAQQFPFPQNVDYEYGFQSANLDSENTLSEFNFWKANFYEECLDNQARIVDNGKTVSEGIGYGMLIMAYMGEKDPFTKLWNFYKDKRNERGLMNWAYSDCSTMVSPNAATDADLDAAMALLVATNQWPEETTFSLDLDTLLSNIKQYEFATYKGITYQLKGDVDGGPLCVNPSYFAPGYYRVFSKYYSSKGDNENAKFWALAAQDTYFTLLRNMHPKTGLVYAWSSYDGGLPNASCTNDASGGGERTDYQYDACRTPWRIATDYLWWGTPEAKIFLTKISNFVKSKRVDNGGWYGAGGIDRVVDGYHYNGESYGNTGTGPFVGSFSLTGMATNQYDADNFMSHFSTISGKNYFNSSITLLYKLLASGNFWNPYAQKNCSYPSIGEDKTICNIQQQELEVQNIDLSADSTRWYVNGDRTSNSGNTQSIDSAACYTFIQYSGNCITKASVSITDYIPQPIVQSTDTICSPNKQTLKLSDEFTSQFNYIWESNKSLIPYGKDSAINATYGDFYQVTVFTDNCEPRTSGKVFVQSKLSPVNKPIHIIDQGESVTLSTTIENAEWYSDKELTTSIGTGKSIDVSPTESTTYYMKDTDSECDATPISVTLYEDCQDSDNDGVNDCQDECIFDPNKTEKGDCGCFVEEGCLDCNGDKFGGAEIDACGTCAGGKTGITPITDIADCETEVVEENSTNYAKVLPTVSAEEFKIIISDNSNAKVSIYSCSNTLIESFIIKKSTSTQFGEDYIAGSYLVVVEFSKSRETYKIIKK